MDLPASTERASLLSSPDRNFTPIIEDRLPLWDFDFNGVLLPEAVDAGTLRDYREFLWTKAILVEMYVSRAQATQCMPTCHICVRR